MIQFFKSLSITLRVRWFLSLFVSILFIIISTYLLVEKVNNIEEKIDNFIFNNLDFLKAYAEHNEQSFQNEKLIVTSIVDTLSKQVDNIQIPDTILDISLDTILTPYKTTRKILLQFEELSEKSLENLFYKKRYLENGYAMLLNLKGEYLIHPSQQGESIRKSKLFSKIINHRKLKGKINYEWPENDASESQIMYFDFSKKLNAYLLITVLEKDVYKGNLDVFLFLFLIYALTIILLNIVIWLVTKSLGIWLSKLDKIIAKMAKGSFVEKIEYQKENEIGRIVKSLNTLIETSSKTSDFSKEITKGNFKAEFEAQSEVDILGNSLLEMRESLIKAASEEEKRKIIDAKQKWITSGLAKFGDILRQDNDNLENLSYNLINNLVNYLDANQGGIFIKNKDFNTGKITFELKSSVAYDKRKYIEKTVEEGEGLIGRCAKEISTIYLTEVPENYIEIRSGMGHASPKSILLVPLKVDQNLFGVVEIASFRELEKHEIEFVEKIAENIASTIASVKINLKTANLLQESEKQSKRLEQQEEDMKLNLKELQRTQEFAAKNEETALGFVNAVNHTIIRADFNLEGKLTYANSKLLESMEYSSSELKDVHFSFFMQKKDMKTFDEAWLRLSKGGSHYEEEVEYKTKFGKIWLLATYTAVRDRKGNIVKVLYLAINISQEKKVSINYENDMNAINASILKSEYKPDGTVLEDNDIFLETLGYRRADTVGKNLFDFLSAEKQKNFNAIWAQVLSGIAVNNIEQIQTKTGVKKWFKGTYTPVKNTDNEVYKIIYIANEITAQKNLEDETRKRNNELLVQEKELQQNVKHSKTLAKKMEINEVEMKGLLRAIDASTYSMELNLENKILKVNKAYTEIFKLSETEFTNRSDRDLFLMANHEKGKDYDKLWNEVKFGLTKKTISRILINDIEAWLVETYTPIFDSEKNVYKILKISTDITQNKKLEIEASKQAEILKEQELNLVSKMQELEIAQKEMELLQKEDEKRNEETLKTIEKHQKTLTDIIDNVPGKIFLKDNHGKMLIVNEAVAKVHNQTKEELIGKSDFDFFDEQTASKLWNEELRIINSGAKTFIQEEELSGEIRIFQTTKMPFYITYLGVKGMLGVQTDITELKKMEMDAKAQTESLQAQEEELRQNLEELQATQEDLEKKMSENLEMNKTLQKEKDASSQQKEFYQNILDKVPNKVFLKDHEGKMIFVNEAVVKAHGSAIDSLLGKSDFDFFDAEKAKMLWEEELAIMRSGAKTTVHKDTVGGYNKILQTTKLPFIIPASGKTGILGIQNDVTEMKTLEEEAKQQAEELMAQEEELRQNLEELQAIQEDLMNKNNQSEILQKNLAKEQYLLNAMLKNMPDSIYFKDEKSNFIRASLSMVKAFGLDSEDDMKGKSDFDFNGEHARVAFQDEQNIIRTGSPLIDVIQRVERKNGESKWLSTTKMPLHNEKDEIVGTFGISRDITAMKEMEIATQLQNEELAAQDEELRQHLEETNLLKESFQKEKKLLDTLLENIPDAIYFKDLNSKFIRASKSIIKGVGLSKVSDIIGKSDFDFFEKENAQEYFDEEQEIIKTGNSILEKMEREKRKIGDDTWVIVSKMPIKNEFGEIIGTFGISKDITKMKELEFKTENQKVFYQNIIDKIPNKVFVKNHEGKMIFVNEAVVKAHGTARENLLDKSDFDFFDAEKAKTLWEEDLSIMKNGSKTTIHTDTVTGDDLILQTTKMPFTLPSLGTTGLLGIQHDITEIKNLEAAASQQAGELIAQEEELRQNLEELQAIQEDLIKKNDDNEIIKENLAKESSLLDALLTSLPESIYFKDKEGKMIKCSQKMARNMGLTSPKELIGKTDFDFLPYEIAERYHNIEQKIIRTGQGIINKEEKDALNDTDTWISSTMMPLMLEDKIIGTFGITRDITEIKVAQLEAKDQAEELKSINEEQEQIQTELRWEKQMFNSLMDALSSRVTFKSLDGKYLRINKSKAEKLNLFNESDAIGKSDLDYFDRKISFKQRDIEKLVINEGEAHLNFINKVEFPSGDILWGDSSIFPIRNNENEILGILDLTKGITKQKEAEFRVFEKDYKINGITEKTPVLVFNINKLGKFTELRGNASNLLNIPENQLIGTSVFDLFPHIASVIHQGLEDKEYSFNEKYEKEDVEVELEYVFRENPEVEKTYFGYAYQKEGDSNLSELSEITRVKNAIKTLKK